MKVRATRPGFYDLRRIRPGDIFDLADEKQFSSRWMEKVDAPAVDQPDSVSPRKGKAKKSPQPSRGETPSRNVDVI